MLALVLFVSPMGATYLPTCLHGKTFRPTPFPLPPCNCSHISRSVCGHKQAAMHFCLWGGGTVSVALAVSLLSWKCALMILCDCHACKAFRLAFMRITALHVLGCWRCCYVAGLHYMHHGTLP